MVKISEVLDKAYGEGFDQRVVENAKQSQEIQQRAPLKPGLEKYTEQHQLAKSLSGEWDERLFKAVNDDSYLPEVFKSLRSKILHPLDGGKVPKTIMVTSAIPKEGKSFITANLGISLAHGMDQHSLLVDCDLRKPMLAKMFGLDNRVGLVDYLRDDIALSELIEKTPIKTLSLLTSGKPPANPAELLGSTKMSSLVEELSGRYEDRIIIFDSPPMLVATESSVLAGQVDAIILVVRQSTSGKAQIQKLIDTIGTERILGIVFNDQTINPLQKSVVKGYGYYHGDYYHQ
jgi:exopolysaccharide/PEP-CTERM locus tyrosine autokinase